MECNLCSDDLKVLEALKTLITKHKLLKCKSKPKACFQIAPPSPCNDSVSTDSDSEYFPYSSPLLWKFDKLLETYQNSQLRQGDLLHISVLKQLFLDCYVRDQGFMNLLCSSLEKTTWVGMPDYLKCLQSLHQKSFLHYLFPEKYGKKNKKYFKLQKMLCKV